MGVRWHREIGVSENIRISDAVLMAPMTMFTYLNAELMKSVCLIPLLLVGVVGTD